MTIARLRRSEAERKLVCCSDLRVHLIRRREAGEKITESGGNSEDVTPVPIPNTVVKLFSADDTWRVTARESRTLPVFALPSAGMNLENSIDEKFSQTSIPSMHEPENYKVHDNFRKQ